MPRAGTTCAVVAPQLPQYLVKNAGPEARLTLSLREAVLYHWGGFRERQVSTVRQVWAGLMISVALAACGKHAPVQSVDLVSGDFGVAEPARILGIDPINLQNNVVRFDLAFGEFALSLLGERRPQAVALWSETTRSFGNALTAELEDYIRGLSCVYTVRPEGGFISGAVADAVRLGGEADETGDTGQGGIAVIGAGVPFDQVEREDKGRARRRTDLAQTLDVSIISNCLLDVYVGDPVRIVQTPDRMIVLPQRTAR